MAWNKPLPHPTEISTPYWKVRPTKCASSNAIVDYSFFPRTHCPYLVTVLLEVEQGVGRGHALQLHRRAHSLLMPEFTDEMPQALAVVEFREVRAHQHHHGWCGSEH
jgi:hypothetical protein